MELARDRRPRKPCSRAAGQPGAIGGPATPSGTLRAHFASVAASYDQLRNDPEMLEPLLQDMLEAGDLAGRLVLDVGCGTGRMLQLLAMRHRVAGAGIDSSPEMVQQARRQAPPGVKLQLAEAERLPFGDRTFERALLSMVVHLVDRPRAFAELARVLTPGGRLLVVTPDPAGFAGSWLARLFPSYVAVERARFPSGEELAAELTIAGFGPCSVRRRRYQRRLDRDVALRKLAQRHVSTFALLDEREYQAGVRLAERTLPAQVRYTTATLLVAATRPERP